MHTARTGSRRPRAVVAWNDRLACPPARPSFLEGAPVNDSLLYLLNVSNPDRLSSDSGWLFADILTPALCDAGVRVTIGGPAGVSDPRVAHASLAAPRTKYQARFGFDVEQAAALLRRVRPSVVVANQVESAPGLRAAMLAAGADALLAGYCHYVPFHLDPAGVLRLDPSLSDGGLGMPVLLAFFAGLLACDRVMVHSAMSQRWITTMAGRLGLDLGDRVRVVAPPADPRLVRDPDPAPAEAGPVGVYNHRLYDHYGTARFVELAGLLGGALPVRLRVMDLFGARRSERTRLDSSPDRYLAALGGLGNVQVVSDHGDRRRYRSLLAGATFAFAPFRPAVTWSMSVIDAMGMGLPVVAPRLGWLAEAGDPALLFDEPAQAVTIVARLLTDPAFTAAAGQRAVAATRELNPTAVARAYLRAVT
jgi:glycosyltransferase involved in cell wall biosynthesis